MLGYITQLEEALSDAQIQADGVAESMEEVERRRTSEREQMQGQLRAMKDTVASMDGAHAAELTGLLDYVNGVEASLESEQTQSAAVIEASKSLSKTVSNLHDQAATPAKSLKIAKQKPSLEGGKSFKELRHEEAQKLSDTASQVRRAIELGPHILMTMPDPLAAVPALCAMETEASADVLASIDAAVAGKILGAMDPDFASWIVQAMDAGSAREALAHAPPESTALAFEAGEDRMQRANFMLKMSPEVRRCSRLTPPSG